MRFTVCSILNYSRARKNWELNCGRERRTQDLQRSCFRNLAAVQKLYYFVWCLNGVLNLMFILLSVIHAQREIDSKLKESNEFPGAKGLFEFSFLLSSLKVWILGWFSCHHGRRVKTAKGFCKLISIVFRDFRRLIPWKLLTSPCMTLPLIFLWVSRDWIPKRHLHRKWVL